MLSETIRGVLVRDLRALAREVAAYPDDAAVWRLVPGTPNVAGTLALHVAGNLQHFVGAVLGHSGYVRDRDAEFSRRDVPRTDLVAEVERAADAVDRTLGALCDDDLPAEYPQAAARVRVSTADMLVHLVAHLTYHLGQVDYHRRAVTGDNRPIGAVAIPDLPSATPAAG